MIRYTNRLHRAYYSEEEMNREELGSLREYIVNWKDLKGKLSTNAVDQCLLECWDEPGPRRAKNLS